MKSDSSQHKLMSRQGGTLVEVMIAAMILAAATIGALAVFSKCSVLANELKEHAIAGNALNERIEEIRAMDYATITALGSTFTTGGFTLLNNVMGIQVIEDAFSDDDIRKVTLTVSWTSSQGRDMNKSLSTYIANSGIDKK